MKKLISAFLTLSLTLSLCACNSSVPTETDTTTKFTSEGFTLSVPNEYADLLIVDTTFTQEQDGTFFSVREKASVNAAKTLWPDDETIGGGFLFGIGRIGEAAFHQSMMAGMTGMDVFARDEKGNYYIYYHPTDVQLIRVGDYTDADWELWTDLCEWAAGVKLTFLFENRLTPYYRTYTDIDCALHYITYGGGTAHLTKTHGDAVYTPDLSDSLLYLEQLLDDVLFYTVQSGDFDPEGDYISLSAPEMFGHTVFDFFVNEGQQQFIRQTFSHTDDIAPIYYMANRDGGFFPAGQVMADWLTSLS